MKLILPHLETRSAADLLAGLKGQGPLPPGFEGEGRTRGLGASVQYSLDHLDAGTRALLPALSLFEGVADADVLADHVGAARGSGAVRRRQPRGLGRGARPRRRARAADRPRRRRLPDAPGAAGLSRSRMAPRGWTRT